MFRPRLCVDVLLGLEGTKEKGERSVQTEARVASVIVGIASIPSRALRATITGRFCLSVSIVSNVFVHTDYSVKPRYSTFAIILLLQLEIFVNFGKVSAIR